jgi:hypothetical protein
VSSQGEGRKLSGKNGRNELKIEKRRRRRRGIKENACA